MTVQVYIPGKRDPLQEAMGRVQGPMQAVGMVKGIGGMFGGGGGSPALGGGGGGYNLGVTPMKPVTEGMSGSLPEYTGSSYSAPEAATGAEASGEGMSAGSAAMWGATAVGAGSGLYDLYHAGKGNQSRSDLNRAVKANTGQDLLDWGITGGKSGEQGFKNQGLDYFTKVGQTEKATGWDSGTAARRLDSSFMSVEPKDFFEARKTVDLLPISSTDKDDMLSKLSQGFSIFSKMKLGMG